MTLSEAIAYINNHSWSSSRPGLERTIELLRRLGDPQRKLKFIHIAGTNGKGSTSAMIAEILKEAGYRAGLFPSPYIESFNERIQINGEMIFDEDLAKLTEIVANEADSMDDHPSQFEIVTAIGMLYFLEKKCDIVVLETGMGGRLDSTNVIDTPEAVVITNIGLDHMEYLGDTIEKIAGEKAGIIKPFSDVIVYDNKKTVMEVIKAACEKNHAVMYGTAGITKAAEHSLKGQTILYMPNGEDSADKCHTMETAYKEYELSLLGRHQIKNAATALRTIEVLKSKGWNIPEEAVIRGLKNVRWPARFELLGEAPIFILDGGHNPQCAEALIENIADYLPGTKVTYIIGMLKDKDYEAVLKLIEPYGSAFICVTPTSPRALSGEKLAEALKMVLKKEGVSKPVFVSGSIEEAIRKATGIGNPVVAFGSLYLAGNVRQTYRQISKDIDI